MNMSRINPLMYGCFLSAVCADNFFLGLNEIRLILWVVGPNDDVLIVSLLNPYDLIYACF